MGPGACDVWWWQGKITMDTALDIIDCYRRGGKVGGGAKERGAGEAMQVVEREGGMGKHPLE